MSEAAVIPEVPSADLHRRLGAEFASYRGLMAPAAYGDVDAEYRALRSGCAVVDRSWVDGLEMTGDDRGRFLNGQVTCDVGSLADGQGAYGFLTTVKGRIEADVEVLALADRLWLEVPPKKADAVGQRLQKYVIVDRVSIGPLDRRPVSLIGPGAASLLASLGVEPPFEVHGHRAVEVAGVGARLVRDRDLGAAAYSLWLPPSAFEPVWSALADTGAVAAGFRAFEQLRVEEGRPQWGLDFGLDCFPQETGLEDAVSYTKGCYLGQEVVARIHYRGGVNRLLRGLVFDGPGADTGTPLRFDGREVGKVASRVRSPAVGGEIALAVLHKRVEVGGGVEARAPDGVVLDRARVVDLPFAAG